MRLTKAQRQQVRDRFGGKCAYCGVDLPERWHADHLEAVWRSGVGPIAFRSHNHRIDNMMPSCPPCNISKATLSLEDWRAWLVGHVRALNAHNTPYRLAKAYGLIQETGNPVIFYFERAPA